MLRQTQLSRRLLMLRAVLDAAEGAGYKSQLPGFELLCDVQRHDPDAFNTVVGYPFVGSWAARCLRGEGTEADVAHLNGIAAAAAIRAGMSFSIEVPVRDGAAYLPSLGRLRTTAPHSETIDARSASQHGWEPVRRIGTLALDDIDPFRGGGPQLPVASRLSDEAARAWERSFARAWDILVGDHGDYAEAIGAGLIAIVPMIAAQPNRGVNATSRETFGAAALSAVSDPVALAVGILHEFQHCKLNAVLDLVDLHRPDDRLYYAPWRQDPRPLGGLLHGAYAFVGVCDFWRVRAAGSRTAHSDYAQMEYARWSDRTEMAIGDLLNSGSLTTLGERFTRRMRHRLRDWRQEIGAEPRRLARLASADHRVGWRLRNMRPEAAAVADLARAWRSGAPEPPGAIVKPEVTSGGSTLGTSNRIDLLYQRLRDPGQPVNRGADAQLIAGDATSAAGGYLERIRAQPRDLDAWNGLALALGETLPGLLNAPELVAAVYNRLIESGGPSPDPTLLADWLSASVVSDPVFPSRTR